MNSMNKTLNDGLTTDRHFSYMRKTGSIFCQSWGIVHTEHPERSGFHEYTDLAKL